MKIFQILHGMCHWETPFKSLDETFGKFPTDCLFVEAPDYVTEQWGFDEFGVGDERFIAPEIPEDLVMDDETGSFVEESVLEQALAEAKEQKLEENNTALADFLSKHPLEYTDGKKYAITVDAQNNMRNAITAYNIQKEMGIETPIMWNAVGETAVEWTYADFQALYVAVYKEYQAWYALNQEYAAQINACTTAKEVRELEIRYETEAEKEARLAEAESPEEEAPIE